MTRQRFVDAYWELARQKPISKIAVSELTRRAGYNRSTFYEYFLDTDDLLSYIEDQLLDEIKQAIIAASPTVNSPEGIFKVLLSAMNDRIFLLAGPNGDSSFFSRVKKELSPLVEDNFTISPDIKRFDYLVSFVNSSMLGLLQHWNENDKSISADEMGSLLLKLIFHGLMGYMQSEEAKEV